MLRYCTFDYTDCNHKGKFPFKNNESIFKSVLVCPKFLPIIIGLINNREEIKEPEDTYHIRRLQGTFIRNNELKLSCGVILRKDDYLIVKNKEYCFINKKAYEIIYQELDVA